MCGICGILHYGRDGVPVADDVLLRMREVLRHRGPDDAGSWINRSSKVGLAHRRLSIIDLSPSARQPLANEDDTIWVTFNGEIYNHLELRADLVGRGHRFRSRSDTEVIPHLYEDIGPSLVERLDGMFAFALWDENRRVLLLARDRLGVKPLYYTQLSGMLLFASEIKSILVHPLVSRELDTRSLYHYLTFKTTPAPWTMFAGISKLPAGHWLTCDSQGNIQVHRYWDPVGRPPPPGERWDVESSVARVRELLRTSVAKRTMADVPTGVFLSGGLDSSAVVALLAPQSSRPLNTFSVGIHDVEDVNELHYARQVADRFGTNHSEIVIGRREVEDYFPRLVYDLDEPVADPVCIPLYYVARLARDAGVVVVQVGEGSDEQFFGYDSRLEFLKGYERKWRRLRALPRPVLEGLHAMAGLVHAVTGRGGRYRQILGRAIRNDGLFWGSLAFDESAKRHLLNGTDAFAGEDSQAVVNEVLRPLRNAWPDADIAAEVAYLDIQLRLAELLLMRLDKVTMSVGVEAREPFLDYHLVEYLMTVPREVKLNGWEPKFLLKRAVAGLVPEEILRRPKQAFTAPVADWLRSGLGGFARQTLLESKLRERKFFRYDHIERMLDDHISGRADYGVQLWTLMNLSAWYDHWIAGQPSPQS